MGQTMDQMKMLNQLRKAQKDLKNEKLLSRLMASLKSKRSLSTLIKSIWMISTSLSAGSRTVSAMAMPKRKKSLPIR